MESWNKHILSDTIKMSVEKALQDEARAHHFEEQMEKFAARMDAFDKRMQSMTYAFSNGYTIDSVELVDVGRAEADPKIKIMVKNDGQIFALTDTVKVYNEYVDEVMTMQFGENLYKMEYVPGANLDIDRPIVKLEVQHIKDNIVKLPCYMRKSNLTGSNPEYCMALRLEPAKFPFNSVWKLNGKEYMIESHVWLIYRDLYSDGGMSDNEQHSNFFEERFTCVKKEEVEEQLREKMKYFVEKAKENLKLARQNLVSQKKRLRLLSKTLDKNEILIKQ